MKAKQQTVLMLALAGALSLPTLALAAEASKGEHSGHHPAAAPAAGASAASDRMPAMRARMMEIRATKDPDKRKQLIEAQMKDMEAMLADGSCPMVDGGAEAGGAIGGGAKGSGAMGGKMMGARSAEGKGGMGMAGSDDMAKRMDMKQKMMRMNGDKAK